VHTRARQECRPDIFANGPKQWLSQYFHEGWRMVGQVQQAPPAAPGRSAVKHRAERVDIGAQLVSDLLRYAIRTHRRTGS
jgi:hypothetical protein